MAEIFVKGVGKVKIAGETPTQEEAKAIEQQYKLNQDKLEDLRAELAVEKGFDRKQALRLGLEIGGSLIGIGLSGGFALPAIAARFTLRSKPFITALAKSSGASGLGGATGAGISSTTFDPRDDVVKDMLRAGAEGAIAEALGAPIMIKGARALAKGKETLFPKTAITNNDTPQGFIKPFENAKEAEIFLQKKADDVLKNPTKYEDALTPPSKVIELAKEAKLGMTTAMKTDNRVIDSLDQLVKGSFAGAERIETREKAFSKMMEAALEDFKEKLSGQSRADIGDTFFATLQGSKAAKQAFFKEAYKSIDDLALDMTGITRPVTTIDPVTGVSKTVNEKVLPKEIPMKDIVEQYKSIIRKGEYTSPEVKSYLTQLETRFAPTKGKDRTPIKSSFTGLNTFIKELRSDLRVLQKNNDFGPMYETKSQLLKFADEGMLRNDAYLKKLNVPKPIIDRALAVNKEYKKYIDDQLFEDGILAKILKNGNNDGGVDGIFQAIVKDGKKERTVETVLAKIDKLTKKREIGAGFTPVESTGQFLTKEQAQDLKFSLRGQFAKELIEGATNQAGILNPVKLIDDIKKKRAVYNQLVPKEVQEEFTDYIKRAAIGFNSLQQTGLPGKMMIQMKQSGAVGNILSFGGAALGIFGAGAGSAALAAGGATLFIAPYVMGRIMTNPKLNKIFFEGLTKQQKVGSLSKFSVRDGGSTFRQMVVALRDEGLVDKDEANRAIEKSREVEANLESKGIKNNKDFNTYNTDDLNDLQASSERQPTQASQQQIAPSPTRLPPIPAATTSAAPATQDRGAQYQGLFPLDPTGQAIARRG